MLGVVSYVTSRFAGSTIVGTEAIGQTIISVDSVADFALDLGVVVINGEFYPFTSVDRVNSTLTLSVALTEALAPGSEVKQFPLSVKRQALVEPQDLDVPTDAVWALIPHSLSAFFAGDGPRAEGSKERIKAEREGTQLVIIDVYDRVPQLNRDAIPDGLITETKIEPGSITTPLLAANAVAAQNVQAGAIVSQSLASDAINGMTITGALIRSAATGKRVEISESGITQVDSLNNVILTIGDTNKFTGSVEATDMVIQDSLQLFGRNNLFAVGSKVTLKASTSAPASAPTLAWDYEAGPASISRTGYFTTGVSSSAAGASLYTTEILLGFSWYYKPGGERWQFPIIPKPDGSGEMISEYKVWSMVRIAKSDNNAARVVMIGEDWTKMNGGYPETWVRVYDDSPMNTSGTGAPILKHTFKFDDFSWFKQYKLCRMVNGANWKNHFMILQTQGSGGPRTVRNFLYNWPDSDNAVVNVGRNLDESGFLGESEELAGGIYAMSNLIGLDGPSRVVCVVQTNLNNYVFNIGGSGWDTTAYWPTTFNEQRRTWWAGDIISNTATQAYAWNWGSGSTQKTYQYALGNHKLGAINPLWARYIWRGEASTSYKTVMSPASSIAYRRMARLNVTMPSLPAPIAGVGGARDAVKDVYGWEYFLGQGVSEPTRTSMYRQSNNPSLAPSTPLAINSVTLSTYPVFSGTNPPAATNFPSAAPATIESDSGLLKIDGDGNGQFKDLAADTISATTSLTVQGKRIYASPVLGSVSAYLNPLIEPPAVAPVGTLSTVYQSSTLTAPAGTRWALISVTGGSQSAGTISAGYWFVLANIAGGGYSNYSAFRMHNYGLVSYTFGLASTFALNIAPGQSLVIAVNAQPDSGAAAWYVMAGGYTVNWMG